MGNGASATQSTISLTDYVSKSEFRSKTLLSNALESGSVQDMKRAIQTMRSADAIHELTHGKANVRLLDYLTRPISFQSDEELVDNGVSHKFYKRTPLMIALDLQHIELGLYLRDEIARVKKVQMTFEKQADSPKLISVMSFADEKSSVTQGVKQVTWVVKNSFNPVIKKNAKNVVSASDLLSDDPDALKKMKLWSSMLNSKDVDT